MKKRFLLIAALLCIAMLAGAERRALIIGNSNYSEGRLKNPVNDAQAVNAVLQELDFLTTVKTDLDRRNFEETIDLFISSLRPQDEALFYYSGHGVQLEGENYLLPLGKNFKDPADVKYEAVNANKITEKLAQVSVSVIILDACRDNPFQFYRSASSKGMAIMNLRPTGQYVIYSTASGQVASDGSGELSPFTQAFVNHAPTPNVSVEEMMRSIARDVRNVSNNKQNPYAYGFFDAAYYLALAPVIVPEKIIPEPEPPKIIKPIIVEEEIANAGELRISTDFEVEIWFEGEKKGILKPTNSLNLKNLLAGSYTVEAITADGKYGHLVQIYENQQTNLSLHTKNLNPQKLAALTINSDPSPCKITIAEYPGLELQTPFIIYDPQAKDYTISFSYRRYGPFIKRITSNPGLAIDHTQPVISYQEVKLASNQIFATYKIISQEDDISNTLRGSGSLTLPEGKYQIEASSFGYYTQSIPLNLIATDGLIEQNITFESLPRKMTSSYNRWNNLKTVSFIGTVAGIGVSTFSYLYAQKLYDEYQDAVGYSNVYDKRQQFLKAQSIFNISISVSIPLAATYIWSLSRSMAAKKRINAEAIKRLEL